MEVLWRTNRGDAGRPPFFCACSVCWDARDGRTAKAAPQTVKLERVSRPAPAFVTASDIGNCGGAIPHSLYTPRMETLSDLRGAVERQVAIGPWGRIDT